MIAFTRHALCLAAMALLIFPIQGDDKAADAKVEVKVVKYAEMGKIIKEFKGKIVLVDFWADT
jgi:hypothetical protein